MTPEGREIVAAWSVIALCAAVLFIPWEWPEKALNWITSKVRRRKQ